jgi:hypothetical protein
VPFESASSQAILSVRSTGMSGIKGKRQGRSSVLLSGKWFSLKVSSENKTYESSIAMYDTYLLKIDPK